VLAVANPIVFAADKYIPFVGTVADVGTNDVALFSQDTAEPSVARNLPALPV
jgi:hypothetical protein